MKTSYNYNIIVLYPCIFIISWVYITLVPCTWAVGPGGAAPRAADGLQGSASQGAGCLRGAAPQGPGGLGVAVPQGAAGSRGLLSPREITSVSSKGLCASTCLYPELSHLALVLVMVVFYIT